ncbi:hypothetical protein Back2_05090 [Nocardioides baekrokdamisoli]|uniref:Uncharacterized protein n=1 Tax=Nocardioides baekrokdamisoli TaxID=1804624 RepID=A0A3G9ICX0_9ACTN|nr:hypothetical protein [Nocardioides baekrokdamisoli]BBH16222.1 hypothetical protein Back2_05090 [Nocardioides baekrokdamisoli]
MSSTAFFALLGICLVPVMVLAAIQIPAQRRREAEAQADAERIFAGDPAGLALWRQQRSAMQQADRNTRRIQASITQNTLALQQQAQQQQQIALQQQMIQQQITQQQINNLGNNH